VIVDATLYDPSGCAVDIPTTTSTTTTTTTEIEPSASYGITSNDHGYGNTQTIFTVTGAQVGDIVTAVFYFWGSLNLASGYSSTSSKVWVIYPGGDAQALGECFSGPAFYEISITKPVSFIVAQSTFEIITEAIKINSLNPVGEFSCTITNVKRDGVDYPMSKSAFGNFYKSMQSQFSC